jgi:alkylhydroperoxidase family enzyme
MMRLKPIEKPNSIFLKLGYWMLKRTFGKVVAPAKVIYARSIPILMMSNKIQSTDKKLSLSKETTLLIRNFTSHLNNCPWCSNFQEYEAQKNNMDLQKIKELMQFKQSSAFTEKERVLLSYIEEVTLTKTTTDETFRNLTKYYKDKEIVEITWVNATENYYNLLAKPLGLHSDNLKTLDKLK